jgi:hypothetical protein
MTDADPTREFLLLRSEPTVERWAIELQRVLRGERDFVIDRLGSAAEYAADLVRRAADPAVSAVHLNGALEQQLSAWTPSHDDTAAFHDKLLDLVQQFAPSSGFARMLYLIQDLDLPEEEEQAGVARPPGQDIRLKALHALESYFPAPPARPPEGKDLEPSVARARQAAFDVQVSSFKRYCEVLLEHTSWEKYAPYATRILLQLGVLAPGSGSLRDLIARQPAALRGVLDWCFSAANRGHGEQSLTDVYLQCLESEQGTLESTFYDEVRRAGATMTYQETGPRIFATGRYGVREYTISVGDDPSQLFHIYYYGIRMDRRNQDPDRQLNQATSEHPEQDIDN